MQPSSCIAYPSEQQLRASLSGARQVSDIRLSSSSLYVCLSARVLHVFLQQCLSCKTEPWLTPRSHRQLLRRVPLSTCRPSLLQDSWRGSRVALSSSVRYASAAARAVTRPASEHQPMTKTSTSEAVGQAAAVPSYCSGCGVKLQQLQADSPGWVLGTLLIAAKHFMFQAKYF